mmetsp:Transcript_22691/g.31657  ORF Transcript_22691/g.31657 Transcript_22691/m.31657 type:complete len:394 (-) Transcript_22691:161-1342(-)|eukprot:CAMPEP_0196588434 /NCGR_PEP_ID=MMETSP1081-20130531/60498_1 /TAXON_ID=36882 /ORGANISM="Pyramimonas amylifera, Strain CCMP720" /LENGTH=393 /DNA_ID=CAMNT_0041910925 /DNA_START=103 /DNA_END=1284 /DNA_ORIENTATION=+
MAMLRSIFRNRSQWLSKSRSVVAFSSDSARGSGNGPDSTTSEKILSENKQKQTPVSSIAERMLKESRPHVIKPQRARPPIRGESTKPEPLQEERAGRGQRRKLMLQEAAADHQTGQGGQGLPQRGPAQRGGGGRGGSRGGVAGQVMARTARVVRAPRVAEGEYLGHAWEDYNVKAFNHLMQIQLDPELMMGTEFGEAPQMWDDIKANALPGPAEMFDNIKHILVPALPGTQTLDVKQAAEDGSADLVELKQGFEKLAAGSDSSSSDSDSSTSSGTSTSSDSSTDDEIKPEDLMAKLNGFFRDEREFEVTKAHVVEQWAIWEAEWQKEQRKKGASGLQTVKDDEEAFRKAAEVELPDDHQMKSFMKMATQTLQDNNTFSFEQKKKAINGLMKGL